MSAGVSDQRMKGQGNQVPNVPKDHIETGEDFESWRHQPPNHGPSYVPITTTTDPYNTAYYNSSGAAAAQFQYPPFGVGDGTWSSGNENLTILSGYGHDNYSVDGMFGPSFGQPSTYNYFPGNGDYNTWGTTQQVNAAAAARKSGINYDDYYREQNNYPQVHDGLKNVEQGMQGLGLDVVSSLQQQQHDKEHSTNSNQISGTNSNTVSKQEHPKEKKMTWASIASQPAKPQVSTITSTVKKKGPGMPPPPMIPGKHNMDIGTWDSPSKNGSSMLVPQPPPVITAPPPIVPSPLSQTKLIPQQQQQQNVTAHQQQQQMSHQQIPHPNMGRQQQHPGSAPGSHNQMNVRPNWPAPGDNRQAQPLPPGGMMQQQQQRPNMVGGHPPQMMNFQGPPPPIHHPHHQPHPQQQQQAPPQMQQIHHHQPPQQQQQHQPPPPQQQQQQQQQNQQPQQRNLQSPVSNCSTSSSHHVLEQLRDKNNYNPVELNIEVTNHARFFVIKSYSEDDIHRSIKYEIWCSTEHGNKRLDQAFREREKEGGVIYLLFSVNGSGHFCGVAQMISAVDYNSNSTVWSQNKWKGTFKVNWIYVKDVPNPNLRHIRLENNENKSVTNSRDTQEVLVQDGQQVLRIIHAYKNSTSIFDDFVHYEKRQEEEDTKKHVDMPSRPPQQSTHYSSMQRGGGGNSGGDYDKSNHHNSYEGGKSYGSGAGFDRNNHQGGYEKQHDGRGGSGGYNKNYGYDNNQQFGHRGGRGGDRGGGYHSYDNRRGGGDDRGYDRNSKDHHEGSAGGESGGGGGDYHRSNNHRGGYSRGDRSDYRREDRGGFNRNDRSDQQQHHDGGSGGYNNRGHRDHHRGGDHHGQGRGRGGGGRGGGSGPHRNSQPN